jgi:hypothetical protein
MSAMALLTKPNKIKIKLLEGDTFTCSLMGDSHNAKTYMKWYFIYLRMIGKMKFDEKLLACAKTLKGTLEDLKKPSKIPKKESEDEKAERQLELATCKLKYTEAYAKHPKVIGVCYDLFCQLLEDESQVQWDRITKEVHKKDPWTGLDGVKRKGLRMKTLNSLEDCIMFHKLTEFNCDAVERQKAYMMGSLKKPHQLTIRKHVSHCEVLNGHSAHLPCRTAL